MAVHIAESADVHQYVEAERRSGVEGTQRFVVAAAMTNAQLDDFRDAGSGEFGDEVADLAIGVVAGGVKQRRGQLDLEGFCALDQVDQWCVRDLQPLEYLARGNRQLGLRF